MENLIIPLDRAHQILFGTGMESLEQLPRRIGAGITPFVQIIFFSDDLLQNAIISGDFKVAVAQWHSPNTGKRGQEILEWSNENLLTYIAGTTNSSKRSLRNIDLTFTSFPGVNGTILSFGTSDHWPLIYKSEHINFLTTIKFSITKWKYFETILYLLEEYWSKQSKYMGTIG